MKVEAFWEALKYGPLGLAAIATLLAALLLFQVLKQPQVSKSKRQIFTTYMVFCSALVLVSIGAAVFDTLRQTDYQRLVQQNEQLTIQQMETSRRLSEASQRVGTIRSLIARLDENEMEKARILARRQSEVGDALKPVLRSMCITLVEISRHAEGQTMRCM